MSWLHRTAEARGARCRMPITQLAPIGPWTTPIDPISTIGTRMSNPTRHPATVQSALLALSAWERDAVPQSPATHVDAHRAHVLARARIAFQLVNAIRRAGK